jgi:hypothetical protein
MRRQSPEAPPAAEGDNGSPGAQAGRPLENNIRILSVSYDDCRLVAGGASTFAFRLSAAPDSGWVSLFRLCRFSRTGEWDEPTIELDGQLLSISCAIQDVEKRLEEIQEDVEYANEFRAALSAPKPNPEEAFRKTLESLQARLAVTGRQATDRNASVCGDDRESCTSPWYHQVDGFPTHY